MHSPSMVISEGEGEGGRGGREVGEEGAGQGKEMMCRVCHIPLVPPDPSRRYRSIRCDKCKEVTPVAPPPEDKKFVICSCNALLIVDDDASIFTCTRCKKTKMAVEVPRGEETMRLSSASSSPSLFHSYTVGTVRKNIYRTVNTNQIPLENISAYLEASSGTITPSRGQSPVMHSSSPSRQSPVMHHASPNFSDISSYEGGDIEKIELRMNIDQAFLANFFVVRVKPSVVRALDTNNIWWMRLKILLWVVYHVVVSVMIISNFLDHQFRKQFGLTTLDTWQALLLFIPYIASFCIEWIFNKVIIYGYIIMCVWYSVFACMDEQRRAFFWNFYDCGHLLDEVLLRAFYLRIPRLQVPIYRFFNPPISILKIESEFFFLSDVHLTTLVFKHPKIHFFFKFWLAFAIVVKTLGRAGCVVAIIILPFNSFTIFYAAETFVSLIWMFTWWIVTNRRR